MARSLTLADGQLGATAATLLSGADAPTGYISGLFGNTGTAEQTLVFTFQRAGGTARRVYRAVLQENEQLQLSNLAMQPDDTLLGVTTTASTVDYVLTVGSGGTFRSEVLDAAGTSKGVTTLRKILLGMELLADGTLVDQG